MSRRTKITVLARLRAGWPISQSVRDLDVTVQRLVKQRSMDPDWAIAMDKALFEGRDATLNHGGWDTYRRGCRCPECRDGKWASGAWTRRPEPNT